MNTLAALIQDYYFDNFDQLPVDKQFHFVSRLSSWSDDQQALDTLTKMKPQFATHTLREDLRKLISDPPTAKVNAAERRAPYFAKYPTLRGTMLALFRVRHLLFHYGVDARSVLLEIVPKETLYELSDALQRDREAAAVLSTYAINYIYLVEAILFPHSSRELDEFLANIFTIADTYTDTAEDSLLLIYLFTHCIIGASNFYQSAVQEDVYRKMLTILEARIDRHFSQVNLDNKFEFLVCCKLASFSTTLGDRIEHEAQQSVSSAGTFLVDTLNNAGQNNKISFSDSEHRNVLYIMSQTPYRS